MESNTITMAHGGGGLASNRLIKDVFLKNFGNEGPAGDAAVLEFPGSNLAFTTDSFVVTPLFFSGGDIGKLAVCGTVNDLAAAGARPLYISCGFILEEGFPLADLEKIANSMAKTALEAGVRIVCGDTKVVHKGGCDGVYINTSGVGVAKEGIEIGPDRARAGDMVMLSGYPGEHAAAIMTARQELGLSGDLKSDCAPLNRMVHTVLERVRVNVLRDPTRGGVAASLNEIAIDSGVGIELDESSIVVPEGVGAVCSLLGYDPLYLANEGKMIFILPEREADLAMELLHKTDHGSNAAIIGRVVDKHPGKLVMRTKIGGRRLIDMPYGELIPRIC